MICIWSSLNGWKPTQKHTFFFSSHELLDVSQDLTTACSILSPDVGLQNNNWCISQSGLRLRVFDLQVLQIWPGVESYRLWNMRCATDLGWSCVWFNPRNLQSPANDPFTLRMNPGAAPKKKKNWRYLLCKRFSSALLQRRCQSQKKNGRLFICRLWNWLYRGKNISLIFSGALCSPFPLHLL